MITLTEIQDVADRIAAGFDPDKIILFGSYANGSADADSDVDLLVVLPFDGKPFWKSVEIVNRVDPQFSIDVIARDSADTSRRYAEGDPLIHDALDHGKVLYERSR